MRSANIDGMHSMGCGGSGRRGEIQDANKT